MLIPKPDLTHDELMRALTSLFEELDAADLYFRHTKKKNDIPKVRLAIYRMLGAYGGFTQAITSVDVNAVPPALTYLATEFEALDRGRHSPLFQPVKNPKAPKQTKAEESIKGVAAAAMTAAMNSGMLLEAAGKAVARKLEQSGYVFPRNSQPWRTVAKWRNDVIGTADITTQKTQYEAMLILAEVGGPPPTPKHWAVVFKYICQSLQDDLVPNLRPIPVSI